jgi:hypothetical protein
MLTKGKGLTLETRQISEQRFSKKGEFVVRSIAGETLIVPMRGRAGDLDAIYNLNEVGGFIWERIDGKTSVGEIAEAVSNAFEVTVEQAAGDTAEFLGTLASAGMIQASA